MSKLPLPNSRATHDSPPIKNRKALTDKTETIINSPVYSNKKASLENTMTISSIPPPPLKFDQQRPTKTGIPSITTTARNIEVRQRLQKLTTAGACLERINLEKKRRSSYHPSTTSIDTGFLRDPVAIKRQNENNARLVKMVDVSKDKLVLLKEKLANAEQKNKELLLTKVRSTKTAMELRAKISDTEIALERAEHQLHLSRVQLEKSKVHQQKTMNVELTERATSILKDFDELKAALENELQLANTFDDSDSKKEVRELEVVLRSKQEEYQQVEKSNEKELEQRKQELQQGLDGIIREQESRDEEFSKKYELESDDLNKLINNVEKSELNLSNLEQEIKTIAIEITKENDLEKTVQSTTNDLERELELLKSKNKELDSKLADVSHIATITNQGYDLAKLKYDKEKKLRRRIQNTIEDLTGKLRVYVRVVGLDTSSPLNIECNKEDHEEQSQNLTIDNKYYKFDKVFPINDTDDNVTDEIITLSENNLNGANTSVIFVGYEDNVLIFKLLESTIHGLLQREDRYKDKQWVFRYSFQIFSITKDGVIDLFNGSKSEVKLENRKLLSTATIINDYEEVKSVLKEETPKDSSTFITLTVHASNEEKSFTSSTSLLNLSAIEGTELILHAVKKIDESKYSSIEFANLPMYQLVHHLYSNTKALTFFNITDNRNDLEENLKLVSVASFIHSVNAVPVKRVYSSKIEKS